MKDFITGMTELAPLFFIVLLIYLLQCICWVAPRATVFALKLRGGGKRRQPGFAWNAFNTAGVLANPLPPLSPLLVVQWPAFELNPDAIHLPAKDGTTVSCAWQKLELTRTESGLLYQRSPVFEGPEAQVAQYAELLAKLQAGARARRQQIIQDWLRKTMNAEAASRRVHIFIRRSCWLRILASFEFLFLFLLVPLAFERFGTAVLWRVIVMQVIISIAAGLEFWTLHKAMLPQSGGQRLKSGIPVFLSPISVMRACDAVARDLLSGFHPLAVAGAVLPENEFRSFAGEQLRLCRFGEYLDKQYQAALQRAMEQAIRKQQLNPEELLRSPQPESGCVVYCPRCLAQYTKQREGCSDCGYERVATF
jgi:hypothetical protein